MGKARYEFNRTSQAFMLSHFSRRCNNVCRLVVVHSHRQNGRRGQGRRSEVALLDQIGCSGNRIHWRSRLYVHSVQGKKLHLEFLLVI